MERKYKKAKAASKEFARIIEGSSVVKDVHMHSSSLLEQSRAKHDTNPQNDELKETGNLPCEKTTVNTIALQIELENSLLDMENLKSELQKERQFSKSLHDDLDANRKLVLSRDAEIIELTSKLSECERKLKQCEDHLSCTSTDLALERARCDEVMLSLQESETLLSQARSDGLSYILDNQRLIEESREAAQLIVSLQAKLDAQGQDLISTKKALHSLQRAKDEHLLLNTESHH